MALQFVVFVAVSTHLLLSTAILCLHLARRDNELGVVVDLPGLGLEESYQALPAVGTLLRQTVGQVPVAGNPL